MTNFVLLIEDDRLHCRIYSAALSARGFNPVAISDPRIAMSKAMNADVVAIIVDIRLPHVDGREIIQQMRGDAQTCKLPIIAVSAVADHDMAETCLAAGADRFHAKPVPLLTLVSDVEDLVKAEPTAI